MSKIEQQVMGSVAAIYAVKSLLSGTALKVYALVASVWALGALVWVAHIEQNFLSVTRGGVLAVGNFVLSAFAHTSLTVQAVTLVAAFAAGSLLVDFTRAAASSPRRFA